MPGYRITKAFILRINTPKSTQYSERCADSCKKYNVPYEFFEGPYKLSMAEMEQKTGWKFTPNVKPETIGEFGCTVGHFEIWKQIAKMDPQQAIAIFEHDAVVKQYLGKIQVQPGIITKLGYRIRNEDDYNLEFTPSKHMPIEECQLAFQGTHAYAITPETAQLLLDNLSNYQFIPQPIDGIISINNHFMLPRTIITPPPVVAVVGDVESFTQSDGKSAQQNYRPEPEFCQRWADRHLTYQFTVDWLTPNIKLWEKVFNDCKLDPKGQRNILEIGSYEGMSACWMSDNIMDHPQSRLTCIDPCDGTVKSPNSRPPHIETLNYAFRNNTIRSKNAKKIKLIVGHSGKVLPKLKDQRFDLIYVDGSFETDCVLEDARLAYPLLSNRGIIIFNSYGHESVKKAVDYFLQWNPNLITIATGWQIAFQRISEFD